MNLAWLDAHLPSAWNSPGARIGWLLFFALFPLAYGAGILLENSHERPARISSGKNRSELVRLADAFAASKGFPVDGVHHYVTTETHEDLISYYRDLKDPVLRAASHLAPATEVTVLLRSPGQKPEFRVNYSLAGEVAGYSLGKPAGEKHVSVDLSVIHINSDSHQAEVVTGDDQQIKDIVRSSFASDAALHSLIQLGNPTVSTDGDDPERRDVEWQASPPGKPELVFQVRGSVRGAQLVGQHVDAHIEKSFAKRLAKSQRLSLVLNVIYGCFLTFGAVYALVRYVKRTLQKEVSHARTIVVAILFFASYSALIYCIDSDQIAVRVGGDSLERIQIISVVSTAIAFALLGLLIGIGYSCGEGELREAYPGKLTSLDALLASKVFSRDVAASLLFGVATAGWLLFLYQGLNHLLAPDIARLQKDALSYTFAIYPWLSLVLGRQYDSLLIAVAGLLLPASLLLRNSGHRKRRFAWFICFTVLSVLHDAAYPSLPATLLTIVVLVGALLIPFFAFDLLAAMVSLSAFAFVDELTRLCTVFPAWASLNWLIAAFAVVLVLAAWGLAASGKPVSDEDVRPLYAKNLAERMSMQAEILAAREAQLRLLPQAAPDFPGLEFAACCLPAHGVGGDFYDFFQLDSHRLGIFIAQGGPEGLASALCIALAKGVLMYTSRQPLTPVEIILDLQRSFAELLERGGVGGISFAYAVLETRKNTLNYARVGNSPCLLLYREGQQITSFPNWERVRQASPDPRTGAAIYEGFAQMKPGEQAVFFTQGVTSLRTRRFGRRGTQWLDMLMRGLVSRQGSLQSALATMLARYRTQSVGDLTAVVIGVTAGIPMVQKPLVQEGVA